MWKMMFLFQLKGSECFVISQKVFLDTRYQYRGETIFRYMSKAKKEPFFWLTLYDIAGITNATGCKTPCSYLEYVDVGKQMWKFDSEFFGLIFGLTFASTDVTIEEEIFIYPLTSFLAELGGSLGMFLGFSLLMIWDIASVAIQLMVAKCLGNA